MKNNPGKAMLICVVMCLCAAGPAFSQASSLKDLKGSVDDFAENLAKSLPFNSTMGLSWSDAYIGKFPHFGVGGSLGFTTMDFVSTDKLMKQFHLNLPPELNWGRLPIPGYVAEGRLGGFVLPFDVGFKFGYLPMKPSGIEKMDYLVVGGDVRFAVLDHEIWPKISVGMGYNYLRGGITQTADQGQEFSFAVGPVSKTLKLSPPEVDFIWKTSSLDFKAQLSKKIAFITPYLGIGLSHAWSKAGYEVSAKLTDENGDTLNENAINTIKEKFGITDISNNGFSAVKEVTGWSGRLFGGFSFNMLMIRIDLTGMYNFADSNYGATFGLRVQF